MPNSKNLLKQHWLEVVAVVLVMSVAALFRLWQLTAVPPGLHYDEAIDLHQAIRILGGAHPLYITEGWGREALFYYLVAVSLNAVADNMLALRLTAVLCSLGFILVSYFLVRKWHGALAAGLTIAWLAVVYWPVSTGRVGVRNITLPLLVVLTMYSFWWAWQNPTVHKNGRYFLTGVFLGLTLYTYQPARFIPFLFIGFAGYIFLFHRPIFLQQWKGLTIMAGTAVLFILPLTYILLTSQTAESDRSWTLEPLTELLNGNPQLVLENSYATAKMFTFAGDPLVAYNIPDRPVFRPVWVGLFFYSGIGIALWRWRQPLYVLVLMWLGLGLVPTILTISAPHFNRTIAAQLPVMFLTALPIAEVSKWASTRWKYGALLPLLIVFVGWLQTSYATWQDYFFYWPSLPLVNAQYNANITAVAHYLQNTSENTPATISGLYLEDVDPYLTGMILDRADLLLTWADSSQAIAIPDGVDHTRLVVTADRWVDETLATYIHLNSTPLYTSPNFTVFDLATSNWPQPSQQTFHYLPLNALLNPQQEPPLLAVPVAFNEWVTLQDSAVLVSPSTSEIQLLTSWQVLQDGIPGSLTFFVHLLNEQGQIITQQDSLGYPLHTWQKGDRFVQIHRLYIDDPSLLNGNYWIQLGLYRRETGERWLLTDPTGNILGDRLLIKH